MKTDIWMPIYIGDYIADTQHLNAEKHGIYLLLMMHYWKQGPFGNDIEELSCVSKSTEDKTQKILDKFFLLDGDVFRHKRIDKELANASSRSDAARANANKRWDMQRQCDGISDGNATEDATGDAEPMPIVCSSPSPSSSPIQPESVEKPKRKRFAPPTLEELKEYSESIEYPLDCEYFIDYQLARDWKLKSGQKMSDWKAVVRTWRKNNFDSTQSSQTPQVKSKYDEYGKGGTHCKKCGKEADTLKWGVCLPCRA